MLMRARHVWEELKETYDRVDGSVTFNLHHKINTLKQNGSTLVDYYHGLNAPWKQFDCLIELPRCTCHAAEGFKKHNQLMKLMQFLMGLDDSYMSIRSSILYKDPLPVVKSAYATISSEESHRVMSSSMADDQLSTLISLIKDNTLTRNNVQDNMAGIHITSPVSNLKKCLSDESLVIPLDEVRLDGKLHFIEEPVDIMDREVKQLKQSCIPIVKVHGNSRRLQEFIWEREDQFKS
nr:ribonuclease H-like domain-containing protein [Tanacetum cinerariifolium]